MTPTTAILPVKSLARAKTRTTLAAEQRAELAAAMLRDVVEALRAVPELELLAVSARPVPGVETVHDPHETGQSDACRLGIAAAQADRVLLVPGDCPALDPAELATLLACTEPVVIVPDRHGTGTNALLLTPPDAIEPAFGPGSFERHARAAGHPRVMELPSLQLDVDTPDDLRALATLPGGAHHTRGVLDRLLQTA